MLKEKELIEKLAKLEHEQWIYWSKNISEEIRKTDPTRVTRWKQDCWKPYKNLPEHLKRLDRVWARKVLKIINKHSQKTRKE